MTRTFYTIWESEKDDLDNATLLEDKPFYKLKCNAFKEAKKLAKKLTATWQFSKVILVRRIKTNSDIGIEWEFQPE